MQKHKDRPFFLWWTCGPPHQPYKAPPEYEKQYDPAKLILRPNYQPIKDWDGRNKIAAYYAMVTAIDEQLGRLLDELERLELTNNTLFIFTSDHGDSLGSRGLISKCKPFEESIRVPGIISYPRILKTGRKKDMLFSHVDMAPTILSFCGLRIPRHMQGRDLSRLLREEDSQEPEAVFLQIFDPRPIHGTPDAWRGLRTRRYTYARFKDKPWCLFDNVKDPYQIHNLVDKPEFDELQERLDALLIQEMNQTGDNWNFNFDKTQLLHKGPAVYHPDEIKTLRP
jgi:arylsulfatase A-like enzyme